MSPATRLVGRLGLSGTVALAVVGLAALAVARRALQPSRRRARRWVRDYARRSGMPRPANDMRSAAAGFEVPKDFRIPDALRPWT